MATTVGVNIDTSCLNEPASPSAIINTDLVTSITNAPDVAPHADNFPIHTNHVDIAVTVLPASQPNISTFTSSPSVAPIQSTIHDNAAVLVCLPLETHIIYNLLAVIIICINRHHLCLLLVNLDLLPLVCQ